MAGPPHPPRGGMSLYANLLDPKADSSASISKAPVLFKQGNDAKDDSASKKLVDPALRFQPIRRPQVKQPAKPSKPSAAGPGASASAGGALAAPSAAALPPAQQANRTTLADWAATAEDDEYLYGTGEKRQRGGRRRNKKKRLDNVQAETDWDEIYDPARPTNVEEYMRSDERVREVRDWKAVLYAHRRQRRRPSYDSDMVSDDEREERPSMSNQFAPPPSYDFAPPPISPPRAPIPDDATGDDAYARRLAMSGMSAPPAPAPPEAAQPPPPPPPPDSGSATISRAPVRYEPPPAEDVPMADADDAQDDDEEDEAPRNRNRPGQAGFAARLMGKYGWTRGSGLGATEDGITSALRVQVEKRRRKPDAEGGGFAEPGGRGKILGGKTSAAKRREEEGGPGRMSEVVLLEGMLEGMSDLEAEVEAGLGQEIGEECGEKYGRVERVLVDVEGKKVFIKFTDQVSALRAVNALNGRIFNGNTVVPRFYDSDAFEQGTYDK